MKYVTVYSKSEEYGGPEEGGWWYTQYHPVETKRCRKKRQVREWERKFEDRFCSLSTGASRMVGFDSSVRVDPMEDLDPNDDRGVIYGTDYVVVVESIPYERVYVGRPSYS